MALEGDEDAPLPVLFQRAWDAHDDADSLTEGQIEEAVRWLQACSRMVASLSLFSSNEEAEDIATGDLRYLMVPYLLGDFLSLSTTQDIQKRRALLEVALAHLQRFLEQCEELGVLDKEANSLLQQAKGQGMDFATKRTHKIARFKMEKAAREELNAIKLQALRRRRVAELQQEEEEGVSDSNSESERRVWLTHIKMANLKAADRIVNIQQELELLSHAAALPPEERLRSQAQPPPLELMEQLHKAAAGLSVGSAAQMRANVFRPSHILPTRTLEEQAQIEIAMAQRAAESQARAEAKRAQAAAEDKYGEAETERQRAWDDWKDDHPYGSGNSKLRPTA